LPEKTFIAEFEGDPSFMSEGDKEVNRNLAQHIFTNVMGGKPGNILDIGAKLPVLALAFRELGNRAWVLEHEPIEHEFPVLSIQGDFETYEITNEKFSLITLIHTFEHLYDPHAAIRKLRQWVKPDGAVFIRIPDHALQGFERDLTPGHYQIHPFYYSLRSFLQLLYEEVDQFVVTSTTAMNGHGQRDIVLRPIDRAPKICLGMIVKNEQRDLPRCLNSAREAYDQVWIVDTGSDDGTEKIAQEVYLGASDPNGLLNDFSKARNHMLDAVDDKADWVLCLDADDELETPLAIRRASYCPAFSSFAVWIRDGVAQWSTHRFWKTKLGIRFEGRCHEYPNLIGDSAMMEDVIVRHHGEPNDGQENSNARNLRILMLDWTDRPNPRTAFYLANTHRDGGRWKEAVEWYEERISMGTHYLDEWLFAHLYLVRCLRQLGETNRALWNLSRAVSNGKGWCEFHMEYAHISYTQGDYPTTIGYAMSCMGKPIPPTALWREPGCYTDGPPRLVSWCYESMGKIKDALSWAMVAKSHIVGPDASWDERIMRLSKMISADPTHA
jgi:glycosyltransferase involved in cell wall biosynthesis